MLVAGAEFILMRMDDVIRSLGKSGERMTPAEAFTHYLANVRSIPPTTFGRRFGSSQKIRAIDRSLLHDTNPLWKGWLLERMGKTFAEVVAREPDTYLERAFSVRFSEYRDVLAQYFPEEDPVEWAAARGLEVFDRAEKRSGEDFSEARRVWREVTSEADRNSWHRTSVS